MPASISQRVYYSGRVQGVGFRYSVKRLAAGFEVVGWVRNLSDGRVEVEATGESAELHAFVDAIGKQMASYIQKVEQVDVETVRDSVKGFEIRL